MEAQRNDATARVAQGARVALAGTGANARPDALHASPAPVGAAAESQPARAVAESQPAGAATEVQPAGAVAEAQPDASPALVALVGAGPGRLDLITVHGLDLLKRADVVIHDRLDTAELLALAGVRSHAGRARLIDVGKHASNHPVPQGKINRILVVEARNPQVKLVVRLKGGDPYVFGRGGEEASALAAAQIPFEVVPGISSALAALSYAGVPVTDRRHAASFHVLTGHRRANGPLDIDFKALAAAGGTDIFLMSVATLDDIARGLLAAGRDSGTPACVVERGTSPRQRRIDGTLATIGERAREASVESPAILVVGEVCSLAPELDWFDRLPLRGRRIAVTRPADRAKGLVKGLRALGADVLEAPLIETVPRSSAELVPLMHRLGGFSWIVLTSTEGVSCLRAALQTAGLDARALAGLQVAAVGPATADALAGMGVRADLVPQRFDTEHLARELVERIVDAAAGPAGPADSAAPAVPADSAVPAVPADPAAGLPWLESVSVTKAGFSAPSRPESTPTGEGPSRPVPATRLESASVTKTGFSAPSRPKATPTEWPTGRAAVSGRLELVSGLESVSVAKAAFSAPSRPEATPTEGRTRPVLLFRAKQGSPSLLRALQAADIAFEDVAAYETRAVESDQTGRLARELLAGEVDVVTLTSPSCANALAKALDREDGRRQLGPGSSSSTGDAARPAPSPFSANGAPWPACCTAACLGPSARAAAESHGMSCIEAEQATVASLIDAIRRSAMAR